METFRIFCAAKNEPNPQGGLTPQGSLSISAQLKAEGNTRCRSHFFALIPRQKKYEACKGFASYRASDASYFAQSAKCFIRHSRASFISTPLQIKQLRYKAFAYANMKRKRQ